MKKLKSSVLVKLIFLVFPVCVSGQKVFDLEDFGAKGDGIFMNTNSIQKAIDSCSQQGGGTVLLRSGTYLSGSLFLKDNVTLHLDANAVLLGSPRADDYKTIGNFKDGLGHAKNKFFIGASEARNIGIRGEGVINGQGSSPEFKIHKDARGDVRPTLVKFYNCEKVRITDITLRNSGAWVSHYFGCTDVLIQNINIDSWSNGNNDGIDIDCCENVRIDNCNISSRDDAIVLKATANRPTRNVVVSNCILHTSTGAFKIGTESVGDIQNVTVSNCAVRGAGGGIKLLCMDGSIVSNINISGMVMQNVEMPVFIRLGSRLNVFHEGEKKKDTGGLENVKIQNLIATANSPGRTKGHKLKYQSGIFITGIPGHPVKNLSLENISIKIHGGGTKDDSFIEVPENSSKYPEFSYFSDWLPAYGAYVRHARNVRFENVTVETVNPDQRYGIALENVEFFTFKNIQADYATGGESLYLLKKVKQGTLSDHFPDSEMKTFITVQGDDSEEIYLFNNNPESQNENILLLEGAMENSVKINK
jgi:polygalacturonase